MGSRNTKLCNYTGKECTGNPYFCEECPVALKAKEAEEWLNASKREKSDH